MQSSEFDSVFGKHFELRGKLSDTEIEYLSKNTAKANYKKGQHIHEPSEHCTGVTIVNSGCLRVYLLSDEGRDITLYRLFEGDICLLSASCVLSAITFDVFIDAEEDSEVFILNSGAFDTVMKSNIYLECFAYKLTTTKFSDVMWTMQQILFKSFDKRLAIFLNDEAVKNGSDTVKLTHEQIAKYVGSAREVVSRMLKHFSNEKIVELSRGGIKIIDRKKLFSLCV